MLYDGDLRSKTSEHLSKLTAYITTSNYDQMFWNSVKFHHSS